MANGLREIVLLNVFSHKVHVLSDSVTRVVTLDWKIRNSDFLIVND